MKNSKIILSLIFVFIFIFSAFAFTACSPNCQGLTIPSNQSSGGGSASGGSDSNGGDNEQKYSDIVIKLMTDDYYYNIARTILYDSTKVEKNMLPIPYKFLREHGHNVDAYLEGTLNVFASSYIYDNDHNHIYVSVKAENVSYHEYGNYYTNYVLKYPLTNREYEEYVYLNKGINGDGYVQGLLFIQELDNQKTPEIVNQINIAVKSYDDMIEQYSSSKNINFNKYYKIDMDIYVFNKNEIEISVRAADVSTKYTTKFGKIKLLPSIFAQVQIYDNNVNYLVEPAEVDYGNLEEYQSSLQDITAFSYGYNILNASPYPGDYPINRCIEQKSSLKF